MNATTRKRLDEIVSALEEFMEELGQLSADEQAKRDNLPESLTDSEKGEALGAAADALQEASASCEEAASSVAEARDAGQ